MQYGIRTSNCGTQNGPYVTCALRASGQPADAAVYAAASGWRMSWSSSWQCDVKSLRLKSIDEYLFTGGAILPNFIPIRFETTAECWAFLKSVAPTRRSRRAIWGFFWSNKYELRMYYRSGTDGRSACLRRRRYLPGGSTELRDMTSWPHLESMNEIENPTRQSMRIFFRTILPDFIRIRFETNRSVKCKLWGMGVCYCCWSIYSMLSTLVHYYINALNDVMVAIVKLSRQIENLTPSIDAY